MTGTTEPEETHLTRAVVHWANGDTFECLRHVLAHLRSHLPPSPSRDTVECPRCHGKGKRYAQMFAGYRDCHQCEGTGRVTTEPSRDGAHCWDGDKCSACFLRRVEAGPRCVAYRKPSTPPAEPPEALPDVLPAGNRWHHPGGAWQTIPNDAVYDAQSRLYRWEQDEADQKTWASRPSCIDWAHYRSTLSPSQPATPNAEPAAWEGGIDDVFDAIESMLVLKQNATLSRTGSTITIQFDDEKPTPDSAEAGEVTDEELIKIFNDERWANPNMGGRLEAALRALFNAGVAHGRLKA